MHRRISCSFLVPLLLAIGAAGCVERISVSALIGQLVSKKNTTELRLADATWFDWSEVGIFGPYTPRSAVCGMLNIGAGDCERLVPWQSMDDGEMSLAFVKDGQLVHHARHMRVNGDFTPLPDNGILLSRERAVFHVRPAGVASSHGGTWYRLTLK